MPSLSPNQLNHNEITGQENNINATEQSAQHLSRLQNEIGSKVLSLVNFESKHKDIVESSFNKARNKKEKLPGKNNERRNFAYLSRLDRMIEKHGDALEQKLWEASAENVVMDYEDIPEAYWKQQEQILRDNGQGRKLSEYEKEILAEDLIDKQRQSITSWADYLGDKNCPYPLWFKVYAFDGISKMSNTLNLDDADYNRRDNTTALSFPKLNAEILAKVYRQINDFYGVDKKDWLSKNSDDEKLVSLVKSANFPKLYAKELVDTKVILKTPERTEDVHGDWFEYKLGDEEEIASLAEGTRWCVVDPNVAHNYLTYGQYSNPEEEEEDDDYDDEDDNYEDEDYNDDYDDEDWEDDDQEEEHDDNDIKVENPEAKFIIFRLEDPNSPGVYASNGSASIRLDPDGIVAEVSGLNEGQAIEDALVPIVKEKALSLPGGEKYLQKFDDKQALIRLDKKMEKGEDLTKEDLSFLYELDRPIATLDTYNREDPRIPELKEKYDIEYALEKGVDANKMVASLDSYDITKNLDTLFENGAGVNNIVNNMDSFNIEKNLDYLLRCGADINNIVNNMDSDDIATNLDTLLDHDADIDNIVSNMTSKDIGTSLDALFDHGANINVNELIPELNSSSVSKHLNTLLDHGADINSIVNNMDSDDIRKNLDALFDHGADINIDELVSNTDSFTIANNIDSFLRCGADVNNIANNLDPGDIFFYCLRTLLQHGADANNIVKNLSSSPVYILYNLNTLLEHGANIDFNKLVSDLRPKDIATNLDTLLQHGADINNIVNNMNSNDIEENLDYLLRRGADINNIVNNMDSNDIHYKVIHTLLEHGADINNIVNNMDSDDIATIPRTLLKLGTDVNLLTKKMSKTDIEDNIDLLREYGANLDTYQENN